jgi:hypothetical protein
MWRKQHAGRVDDPRTNVDKHRHDDHCTAQQAARDPNATHFSHEGRKGVSSESPDVTDLDPEHVIQHSHHDEQPYHNNDQPVHTDGELAAAARHDPGLYPPDPRHVCG